MFLSLIVTQHALSIHCEEPALWKLRKCRTNQILLCYEWLWLSSLHALCGGVWQSIALLDMHICSFLELLNSRILISHCYVHHFFRVGSHFYCSLAVLLSLLSETRGFQTFCVCGALFVIKNFHGPSHNTFNKIFLHTVLP